MVWEDPVLLEDVLARTSPLGAAFFGRNTEDVAHELIGTVMVMDGLAGRIVETEAYLGGDDLASHSAPGPTARNAVMFGPAGFTYVYLIYGMYHCVNFVTEREGVPGAVLIRGVEPLCGRERMRARRETAKRWEELASGPGRLTRAFGITPAHHHQSLENGPIQVRSRMEGAATGSVLASPRIGIRKCADWPLRFFEEGNACVSRSPLNALGTAVNGRFRAGACEEYHPPEKRPRRMRR